MGEYYSLMEHEFINTLVYLDPLHLVVGKLISGGPFFGSSSHQPSFNLAHRWRSTVTQ